MLSLLTKNDQIILDTLRIGSVFDLRARAERESDPTNWSATGAETFVFKPGHKRRLVDMAADYPPTPKGAEALMLDFYAALPRTMAHVFGEVLVRISEGAVPCIIHCSAGKDRTGMAVALLLSALGFDRHTILTDYAASSRVPRMEGAMARSVERDEAVSRFRARYPAEARAVMIEARPDYLVSALDAIEREPGGMKAYLAGIGANDAVIARLRSLLLEPSPSKGHAT